MIYQFKDIMIDLETLGKNEDCVILSIGAACFDIINKKIGPTIYMPLKIEEQMDNRKIDASTLKWWFSQSDAAKKVFNEKGYQLPEALDQLRAWIKDNANLKNVHVWGNGSTFDISILEHAFRQNKITPPWQYWHVMDLRTFRRFVAGGDKVDKKVLS